MNEKMENPGKSAPVGAVGVSPEQEEIKEARYFMPRKASRLSGSLYEIREEHMEGGDKK